MPRTIAHEVGSYKRERAVAPQERTLCAKVLGGRVPRPIALGVDSYKNSRSAHFFKHSDMKALRSSPFLPAASALHVFILFCCFSCLLALRQSFMKALRSSPFLPSASLLQVAILLC